MTRAYDLFEAIRAGGFAQVEAMVSNAITEELFLDYKQTRTEHPGHKLDDSDRHNIAKAISGFGNSDGGIIIWGVNCRSVPGEGDIPIDFTTIPNVLWFKSLLDAAITGLTLPAHSQIENLAVPKLNSDEGVIVSYIPAGMDVPLQCLAGKKYYYIRAGSNFEPAPHGVLAGMFGRKSQPQIKGKFVADSAIATKEGFARVYISVVLTNSGRGVADDVHMSMDTTANSHTLEMYFI